METVNGLILVLVLLADQGSSELGAELAKAMQQQFPQGIELVVDPEAGTRLEGYGVGRADILADRNIGKQLTRFESVVIVHLEERKAGKDRVLTAKLWFDGRSDSFVAIAGPDGDPVPDLLNGVTHLLRPTLAPQSQGPTSNASDLPLTVLVEREAWQPLLGVLAAKKDKVQRDWYYMVLAYVRLEQRDAAVQALNEFREQYGKHFLVAAAEAIIPPPEATDDEVRAAMPDDNQMPEQPERPGSSPRGAYELTEEIEVDAALKARLEAAKRKDQEAAAPDDAEEQPAPQVEKTIITESVPAE